MPRGVGKRAPGSTAGTTAAALLLPVLLLLAPLLAAAAAGAEADEATLMHDLRQLVHQSGFSPERGPVPDIKQRGWDPEADAHVHHCSWFGVLCNKAGNVSELAVEVRASPAGARSSGEVPSCEPGQVPPAVARLMLLPHLRELVITWHGAPWGAVLAPEWLQPGALPRLARLKLSINRLLPGTALPDVPPGALPALQTLDLTLENLRSSLPPGWGAGPRVLPALRALMVLLLELQGGGLPPQWRGGLRQLEALSISAHGPEPPSEPASEEEAEKGALEAPAAGPGIATAPRRLPPEWAGAFPHLRFLTLRRLGLTGPIPDKWLRPYAFPSLCETLSLSSNALSGTLPAQLFTRMPKLSQLDLQENRLSGTLPPEWSNSYAWTLNLESNNLSGPAFPPAWLAGNWSFPALRYLVLSNNPQLTGTLPAVLPWLSLNMLAVDSTGMTGSVPESWCHSQHLSLTHMYIGNTSIDPSIPRCVEELDNFQISLRSPEEGLLVATSSKPLPGWRPAGGLAGAGLAAVLLLTIAGLALSVTWHRGWCLRAWQPLEQQAEEPSGGVQAGGRPSPGEGSQHSLGWSGSQGGSASGVAFTSAQMRRHGQLAARLNATLKHGTSWSLPLSLAGPPQLQEQLRGQPPNHRLGLTQHEQPLLLQQEDRISRWLEGAADAGDAASSVGAAPSFGPGQESRPTGHPQWGLPTQSLLLPATALEFLTGDDGQLVELGCGGHALVYLAKLHPSEKLVAAKVFELDVGVDSGSVWRELALLRHCRHPRVVPLLGVTLKAGLLVAAMELMPCGSLAAALQDPARRADLCWDARGRQVAVDVAEALDHLHSQLQMMHSDVKPSNVLLSADYRACLSDLGLAQVLGTRARTAAGCTRRYAAPEQLLGQRCTLAVDVYSMGIVLAELLCKETQQPDKQRASRQLPRAPDDCPQDVVDLVEHCLSADPQLRPTAAQVLARLRAAAKAPRPQHAQHVALNMWRAAATP